MPFTPEQKRANKLKCRVEGKCVQHCGRPIDTSRNKNYCNECLKDANKRSLEQYYRIKTAVMNHYSNRCNCPGCIETRFEFLTIDHINSDGGAHRKTIYSGAGMYRWLVKNNYPPGYQVLCFNCNCGKRKSGVCPHVRDGLFPERLEKLEDMKEKP